MRGGWVCLGLVAAAAAPAFGITLGQVDDFQDGSLQNWTSEAGSPNHPSWVPGPGPFGFDDAFMVTTANGTSGAGGQIAVFNESQWTGDYLAAGVTSIQLDGMNFSLEPVQVGLRIEGPGGVFTSTVPAGLDFESFWQTLTLSLAPADLTGSGDVFATLANVTRLQIEDPRGPLFSSIGFDNITALPEPGSATLLLSAAAVLMTRRRA